MPLLICMERIEAQKRIKLGHSAKNLLNEGFIPAELYGHGVENVHIKFPTKEFMRVYENAGESSIVTVVLEKEEYQALIYGVQYDTLGERVIHVDLYRVKMDEEITTEVPLRFVGEAPAVKEQGGILVKALEELEIEALPKDLPHDIEVDLSSLAQLHSSIHVKDLSVPSGVTITAEPDAVIATITEQKEEEPEEIPEEASVQEEKEPGALREEEKSEKETGGEKEGE